MGLPAINSLSQMEFALYGGRAGMNMNCPSYFNGYTGGYSNNMMNYAGAFGGYYNPSFRGGYPNQDVFTLQNDATSVNRGNVELAAQGNSKVDWSNPQFRGLSDDLNELGDYYIKNSAPSESFMGAAVGGAAFGLMNNPRMIVHPINSFTSTGAVEKMFAAVKDETTELGKLWRNGEKGGYEIVSNAYSRMHKLESLMNGKLGWFRRSLKKLPHGEAEYNRIKAGMEAALRSGNPREIAIWTEEAKRLTNAFTGFIPKGLRAIGLQDSLTWLRSKINPTHYDKNLVGVAEKSVADAGAKTTFGQFMKHSCGIGNGLLFAGMEFALDFKKIQTAFSKDSKTGWEQVGQTAIKGAGSAIGWAVGEGIGAWAGAKIGAAAGTAICPGVGTAIGAVAGLIGGSIGCWLIGKVTHKIIGTDAGTKVEVENMKRTAQGQVQLLQLTAQQAQEDKKLNPRTLQAINNIANFYGSTGA